MLGRRPKIAGLASEHPCVEKRVQRVTEARIPLAAGAFRAVGYESLQDGREHIAFVFGDLGGGLDIPVRVHSECLTGDVFGSLRCDCGPQLQTALEVIAEEGRGPRAVDPRDREPEAGP